MQESFLCGSSVYTGAGPLAVSPLVEAPFRGTGSLIYRYWPISAPYSCGSRRRVALWAISAGPRCGGVAGRRRCKQQHTISTNRSTAESAGGISAGAPPVFPRWCKCPLRQTQSNGVIMDWCQRSWMESNPSGRAPALTLAGYAPCDRAPPEMHLLKMFEILGHPHFKQLHGHKIPMNATNLPDRLNLYTSV